MTYCLLYGGEWRPITHLFRGRVRVFHAEQATAAVCELDNGQWLAIEVGPGDVFTDPFPPLPPEDAWHRLD